KDGSPARWRSSKRSQKPIMAVSRLLKSCAIPPASWPTPCIFWDCANWVSRCLRSVMSSTWGITPGGPPPPRPGRLADPRAPPRAPRPPPAAGTAPPGAPPSVAPRAAPPGAEPLRQLGPVLGPHQLEQELALGVGRVEPDHAPEGAV